jgi:putative chitinase
MSAMITETQLSQIMPNLKPARRAECLPALLRAMEEFEINTPLRAAAFLAQLAHESAELARFEENLNYSWQGLRKIFSKYFRTDAEAQPFHRKPERIANRVYGGRMGNGAEASGDGFRYRGRGPIQITGRANYKKYGDLLGLDLVGSPAQAATPEVGFRTAGVYWRENKLNDFADQQKFVTITRLINGGEVGLEDRRKYYERAKSVLGVGARGFGDEAIDEQMGEAGSDPVSVVLTRGGEPETESEPAAEASNVRAATASASLDRAAGAKKPAAKKAATRKVPTKKAAAKKAAPAKKAAAKKGGAKKAAAKSAKPAKSAKSAKAAKAGAKKSGKAQGGVKKGGKR